MTSKRERLAAAVAGEVADRPPVALWRHFPVDDQDPASLAESTLAFQRLFDFDFVKVTPASSYALVDLGVTDEWRGDPEGTRAYVGRPVRRPEEWRELPTLSPQEGALADHIDCLRRVRDGLGGETPMLATIFSPLSQAKNIAGEERMLQHLRQSPGDLEAGLRLLTESTLDVIEVMRGAGIDGIFYAVQHASPRFMDRETYRRLAEPLDRRILEAAQGLDLNALHLHGVDIFFDLAETYPVSIVNWHDRETEPTLAEGRHRSRRAVCGGIGRIDPLVLGTPDRIHEQAAEARRATNGGRGLVLGTGCVVPLTAPLGNLRAVRAAADRS